MMVLPCHLLNNERVPIFHDNEELAQWTYDNRKFNESSASEILELYNELSLHLKTIIDSE